MKDLIYISISIIFLLNGCKSITSVKEAPIKRQACPDFGFLDLSEEEKKSAYKFDWYSDSQDRFALLASLKNKEGSDALNSYMESKQTALSNEEQRNMTVVSVQSSKGEIIIVPLDLASNAKIIVNNPKSLSVWNYFYFTVCPDEKVIKNYELTTYAISFEKEKANIVSRFKGKPIKELINYILNIDKLLNNHSKDRVNLAFQKEIAWRWFLERLDNTTKNYIKTKYPSYYQYAESSVSFFDNNDYPKNIFAFHTMFRVLFRSHPSEPEGIPENSFRLEPNRFSKNFNLIHTIVRSDKSEYPVANVFFQENDKTILITKLLEQDKKEVSNNWEYITVQFFNEMVGSMSSYNFDLRYVNVGRFDQYEPK